MVLNKKEKERLPSTLKRSPKKAQETYVHTLEAVEDTHGDGEAAHRIAFGSLKHSSEKVGDHWESNTRRVQATAKTPSEAKQPARARRRPVPTAVRSVSPSRSAS